MAANLAAVRELLAAREAWFPDLIVVLLAWPDQFPADEVHTLMGSCPLARIVCCYGPWCDSDGRTRSIWPLAVRVSVAAAGARLARELASLENQQRACRPLPLTASRAEIFEFDFKGPAARAETAMAASVISPDRRWREMAGSALRGWGLQLVTEGSGPPQAVIFDADPWDSERATALAAIRVTHPRTKIVACVGFQRRDLDEALRRSGADGVWFKLAPLNELADCVCRR